MSHSLVRAEVDRFLSVNSRSQKTVYEANPKRQLGEQRAEMVGRELSRKKREQESVGQGSFEENKMLRQNLLRMQEQLEERDRSISTQARAYALTQTQLSASRAESVQALRLLEQLSLADETANQRFHRNRRGASHTLPVSFESEDAAEKCDTSVLGDSLDVSDLRTTETKKKPSAPCLLEEVHEIWQSANSDGVMPLSELLEKLATRVAQAVECLGGIDGACDEEEPSIVKRLERGVIAEREAKLKAESLCAIQGTKLLQLEKCEEECAAAIKQSHRVPQLLAQLAEQAARIDEHTQRMFSAEDKVERLILENDELRVRLEAEKEAKNCRDNSIQALLQDNRDKIASLERTHALQLAQLAIKYEEQLCACNKERDGHFLALNDCALRCSREVDALRLSHEAQMIQSSEAHAHEVAQLSGAVIALQDQAAHLRASLEDQTRTSISNFNLQSIIAGERDNALRLAENCEKTRRAIEEDFLQTRYHLEERARRVEEDLATRNAENEELHNKCRRHNEEIICVVERLRGEFDPRHQAEETHRREVEADLFKARAGEAVALAAVSNARSEVEHLQKQYVLEKEQMQQHLQDAVAMHGHATAQLREDYSALQRQLATLLAAKDSLEVELRRLIGASSCQKSFHEVRDIEEHDKRHEINAANNVELARQLQLAFAEADSLRAGTVEIRQRALTAEQAVTFSRATEARMNLQLTNLQSEAVALQTQITHITKIHGELDASHRILSADHDKLLGEHCELLKMITLLRSQLDAAKTETKVSRQALASSDASLCFQKNELMRLRLAYEALALEKGSLRAELDRLLAKQSSHEDIDITAAETVIPIVVYQDLKANLEKLQGQIAHDSAQLSELGQLLRYTVEERDQATQALLRVDAEVSAMWATENKMLYEQLEALQHVALSSDTQTAEIGVRVNQLQSQLLSEQSERRLVEARASQREQTESQLLEEKAELRERCLKLEHECADLHGHITTLTDFSREKERDYHSELKELRVHVSVLNADNEEIRAQLQNAEACLDRSQQAENSAISTSAEAIQRSQRLSGELESATQKLKLGSLRHAELERLLGVEVATCQKLEMALATANASIAQVRELQLQTQTDNFVPVQTSLYPRVSSHEKASAVEQLLFATSEASKTPKEQPIEVVQTLHGTVLRLENAVQKRDVQLAHAFEDLALQRVRADALELRCANLNREVERETIAPPRGGTDCAVPVITSSSMSSQDFVRVEFENFSRHIADLGVTIETLTCDKIALQREKNDLMDLIGRLQANARVSIALPSRLVHDKDYEDFDGVLQVKRTPCRHGDNDHEDEVDENEGHPHVVFDFDDCPSSREFDPENGGAIDAAKQPFNQSSHIGKRTSRAARDLQFSVVLEANESLKRENDLLTERLRSLLEKSHQLGPSSAESVANQSWALRAVQLVRLDGSEDSQVSDTRVEQRSHVVTGSVPSPSRFQPPANSRDDELSTYQLQDQLALARRNAKASTAAAHRVSSETQQQISALTSELEDMTLRYSELFQHNEALSKHLQTAEDEYAMSSRALIDTAENQRQGLQARIDVLKENVSAAKALALKLATKLRSERARHSEEVHALRTRFRVAALAAGIAGTVVDGIDEDEDDVGLEQASDGDGESDQLSDLSLRFNDC